MLELPEPLEFDWDQGNTNKNLSKHQVTNREAEEVFVNQPNHNTPDLTHSQNEARFTLLGKTNQKRLLTVIYTIRNNRARIISARDMGRKERAFYEKLS